MKKISLFATIFVAFFAFGVMNVEAATSFDGMEENGVITLTENVELASKYQTDDDKEITIDSVKFKILSVTGKRINKVQISIL